MMPSKKKTHKKTQHLAQILTQEALKKWHYFWTRAVGDDGTGSNVHVFNAFC